MHHAAMSRDSVRRVLRRVWRVARVVLAAVAALVLVLLVNTWRKGRAAAAAADAAPPPPPAPLTANVEPDVVAAHLGAAIRFATVSHEDAKDDDASHLVQLRAFLEATYPHVYAALEHETIGDGNLLFTWRGSDASLAPVLFAAHMDVVPVDPGTESTWTRAPFAGEIADGFVWGRGALDDKAGLVGLLEATEALVASGYRPRRTVLLAFGHDEEVGGSAGARVIADTLRQRNVRLAFGLDEGGAVSQGIVPDIARPVAAVGVAEKGYLSVELVSEVTGGHSSTPGHDSAIGVLADAVRRLETHQMSPHLTPIARESFERLAPELPFAKRVFVSNLWLLEPLVLRAAEAKPASNATVRTTTALTMFDSGVKDNVVPPRARAVVNFRILPGDSVASVLAHVREVVTDPRVQVRALEQLSSEPSPTAPFDGVGFRTIATTIRQLFPTALVMPNLVSGATDGRYYAPLADGGVFRFAPIVIDEVSLKTVHGTNERVGVADLARGVRWYAQMIRASSDAGADATAAAR